MPNLFEHLPVLGEAENITAVFERKGVRVERIISHGHGTPAGQPHDQDADEWVLLLRGAARLWIDGHGECDLRPGDYVMLPAHQRQSVTWTSDEEPTIWLAIHCGWAPS